MTPVLQIKKGVLLDELRPQTLLALIIAQNVYAQFSAICTLTSGSDGEHSPNSLHPHGGAVDIRTSNLTHGIKIAIVNKLTEALGENFDVILEATHIHIEYDPR